jgi:integrase
MPLAQAMHEAQQANFVIAKLKPSSTLAERISKPRETIADLLKKMPTTGVKPATIEHRKYRDRFIEKAIGTVPCADLTTKHVAEMLEKIEAEGKMQWAVQIRSRMKALCRRGMALGWMTVNVADQTDRAKVVVKRKRMSLDVFNKTLEKAPEVAPWLPNAMLLALVSGQDLSTVGTWERAAQQDGYAILTRSKTGVQIAIPLKLRLDAIGMSLEDVIARCRSTGVVSKYLIHHIRPNVHAPRGSKIKLKTISEKFLAARRLAGYEAEDDPTFHEIRSLCKRLYMQQGGVDTKALLGHLSDGTAALYENARGLEPIKVKISAA